MKIPQSILKINKKLAKTFEGDQIISFKQARNLREIVDGKISLRTTLKEQQKQILKANVAYITAGKIRCVADRLRPLHLSEKDLNKNKKKNTLKNFRNLTYKANC